VPEGWPDPRAARDVAGFVAAMREVRTRVGLSFRALERQAARAGDVLPSSTTNAALSRDKLPRVELVAAFIRACGGDEDTVARWVTARSDLAASIENPSAAVPAPGGRRRRRITVATALAGLMAVVAAGLTAVIMRNSAPAASGAAAESPLVGGVVGAQSSADVVFVRLQLAHSGLCVGLGPDESSDSGREVVGQYDCGSAVPPIRLDPAPDGTFRLLFYVPTRGIGCVTADDGGARSAVTLSLSDCADRRTDQRFTLEPVIIPYSGIRLRSVAGYGRCLGAYQSSTQPGVQLVQETCDNLKDQLFHIDLR
jgi:hypothetical protein